MKTRFLKYGIAAVLLSITGVAMAAPECCAELADCCLEMLGCCL